MHFKRRRRRAGRVVLFVLATVLLAALGTGMWLLWPRAMRRDMPSAAAPQGTLRGLRLSWSYPTSAGGLSSGGPEVLNTLFADAAAYAQAHGLNALFLDVADAELSSIAFRDRAYETWPGAAADDSLFHKYDPLRALCEQASQAGLAVYAVTPELSGMSKAAPCSTVFPGRRYSTRTRPPSTIRRPCSLLRWTQTASTAPYSIMRGAGRSRRPSACWPARWTAVRRGLRCWSIRPAGHWRYPIQRTVRPSTPQPAL